mgnify:CR=1 FL=1
MLIWTTLKIVVTVVKIERFFYFLEVFRMGRHRDRVEIVLYQFRQTVDIDEKVVSDEVKSVGFFIFQPTLFLNDLQEMANDRIITAHMFEHSVDEIDIK